MSDSSLAPPSTIVTSAGGLLRLAVPLMAGNAVTAVMQFTDRIYLSHVGPAAFEASFPAGITSFLIQCPFIVSAGYVATFAAQHLGAHEDEEVGAMLWPALWLSLIGAIVTLVTIPFMGILFDLIHRGPEVHAALTTLTSWYVANTGTASALAAVGGFLAGTGRTAGVLHLNLLALILNAGFNALFIFGLGPIPAMGVGGAGLGTFLATAITAVAALFVAFSSKNRQRFATWSHRGLDLVRLRRFLRFALPQSLRTCIDIGIWTVFTFAVGALGDDALAANNAVISWNILAFIAMGGMGQAISVAVGQAVGAGDFALARRITGRGLAIEIVQGMVAAAVMLLIPGLLIGVFIGPAHPGLHRTHVLVLARKLMMVAAVWAMGDAVSLTYNGALSGAGDTRWLFKAGVLSSVFLLVLPLWALHLLGSAFWIRSGIDPVLPVWLATLSYVLGIGPIFYLRFRKGGWQQAHLRG